MSIGMSTIWCNNTIWFYRDLSRTTLYMLCSIRHRRLYHQTMSKTRREGGGSAPFNLNLVQNRSKNGRGGAQTDFWPDPPKWSKNGPKTVPNDPKMVPNSLFVKKGPEKGQVERGRAEPRGDPWGGVKINGGRKIPTKTTCAFLDPKIDHF